MLTTPLEMLYEILNEEAPKKTKILPYNVAEADDSYEVDIFIPSTEKDNIDVVYQNGILKVTGEYKVTDKKYIVKLFDNKTFSLKINMPGIDFENSKGSYENGVLSLILPKESKVERLLLQ